MDLRQAIDVAAALEEAHCSPTRLRDLIFEDCDPRVLTENGLMTLEDVTHCFIGLAELACLPDELLDVIIEDLEELNASFVPFLLSDIPTVLPLAT